MARTPHDPQAVAEAARTAAQVLDVVGLFCPLPIIRTAARVRGMEPGQVLEVVADDPVARVDLPNWCKSNGHRYLGDAAGEGGVLRFFIEVRVGRA